MIGLRQLLAAVVTTAALAAPADPAAPAAPTGHADAAGHHHRDWRAAWTAAQHHAFPGHGTPNWSVDGFAGQSVRQVVRVHAGGTVARVRLSNRFGTTPLRIAGASIARSASGAAVRRGSLRPLTFDRSASVTVPVGGVVVSDAARLPTSALDSLAVTLYLAEASGPATFHENAVATTYRARGDHRFDPGAGAFGETTASWYFLAGVDTAGPRRPDGVVVAFGDSITDGYGTTPNAGNRYPDELAERLLAQRTRLGVVNSGISGNKLLADSTCFGEAGVSRIRRDALDLPGARTVVVLLGINDIGGGGFPDFGCGTSPTVTAAEMIDGHRALIGAARARGVRIIGATMLPFKGATGYYTPDKESVRDEVNDWIRNSGAYDAVADLDRALADPDDADMLAPAYDSGDRVHPNDAGARAIAVAVAEQVLASR